MNRLIIIGAGGHGKVVAETAEACGYSDVVFVDQDWPTRQQIGHWSIIGQPGSITTPAMMFCAVGHNATREQLFKHYGLEQSPVLIHPAAVLSPSARLGAGTLVVAGAIVNADTTVGCGTILNTGCSVDHDCVLGAFTHISPGARLAGDVTIGTRSWIGIGAVVKEGVTIGCGVIVGAGAAVICDIEDGAMVSGVPARKM